VIAGNFSDGKGFGAYRIVIAEPNRMVTGVAYQLVPESSSGDSRFEISDTINIIKDY
jgi:hypothetical protein